MQKIKIYIASIFALISIFSCEHSDHHHDHSEKEEHHDQVESVHLTQQQFDALKMKIESLTSKNIGEYVKVTGQLEVPPQNIAEITAIIGANVIDINVIEGEKVNKGAILAYVSHPNLIKIQTDFVSNYQQLLIAEKEFERQEELFNKKVSSGKEYQTAKANYQTLKAITKGGEAQLKQLNLSVSEIKNSTIFEKVPVLSPISGSVQHVNVKIGQFVLPQTEMFDVVNISHLHADLMVYESDIHKVKVGQKVHFYLQSAPEKEMQATVITIGNTFEQNPKAVHLHAEIIGEKNDLITGMFIHGKIKTKEQQSTVLPEGAIVVEGEKKFVFSAVQTEKEWTFTLIEVIAGENNDGWVSVNFLSPVSDLKFAYNNAYYLLAEMKKSETEHVH